MVVHSHLFWISNCDGGSTPYANSRKPYAASHRLYAFCSEVHIGHFGLYHRKVHTNNDSGITNSVSHYRLDAVGQLQVIAQPSACMVGLLLLLLITQLATEIDRTVGYRPSLVA